MSLRLSLFQLALRPSLKSRMLDRITRTTAEGFETSPPQWKSKGFDSRLGEYAEFTALQAEALLACGDALAIEAGRQRLRAAATRLGAGLRRWLGVRNAEEAFAVLQLVYAQIGIDVEGSAKDGFAVTHCFFARYYTEAVCSVVESLDQGLAAGLFGGASLEFSERLTAGRPCCRAALNLGGRDA